MIPSFDSLMDSLFMGFASQPVQAKPTKDMFLTEGRLHDYYDATEDTTIYERA